MLNLNNLNSLKNLERGSGGKGFLAKNLTFNAPLTNSLFASGKGSTTPTFTRATTAYVNDYETIPRLALSGEARFTGARRVRNQLPYSQDFSNVVWSKSLISSSTFTGLADPFGGTTAMKLVVDNGTSVIGNDGLGGAVSSITKTESVSQTLIYSFYAKADTSYEVRIRESTSSGYRAVFNLVTGVVSYENSASNLLLNAMMVAVGNGWYRCSIRFVTGTGAIQGFVIKGCGAGTATTGDGVSGLFIAFAQLEDLTGSAIQVPSEYVSTNALSAPFHGANVDGVKYFSNGIVISQNLMPQSEDLITGWTQTDTVTTIDSGVFAPNGSQSYRVADTVANTSHRINISTATPITGTSFVFSGYIKAGTKDTAVFRLSNNPFTQGGRLHISSISGMAYTEVLTGTATMSSSMVDAGGGWRFVTITVNFPTPLSSPLVPLLYTGPDVAPYIGTGQYVQATAFHMRQNNTYVNSTYLPTTTVAKSVVAGALTIPTTINRGYLSEWIALNHLTQSQSLDNVIWAKADVTVTADNTSVLAPNGTATADQIAEGVAGTSSTGQVSALYTAGSVVTCSIFLRILPPTFVNSWVRVMFQDTVTPADLVRVWFNVETGVVGTVAPAGSATVTSGRITNMGNGWYRCELTILPNALSTSGYFQFMSASGNNSTVRVNNAVYYAWGAQIEVGRGATSYIPTVGATVTRNGDVLTYNGTGNADRLVGTVYSEFTRLIDNGTVGGRVLAYTSASPLIMGGTGLLQSADGTNFPAVATAMSLNTTYKLAMTYGGVTQSLSRGAPSAGTALAQAYDGDFGATATLVSIGTISGSTEPNGCIRNVKIYKVKVSDTQLTALTA